MAGFKWTSAIELGHAGIDEQHRRLFLLADSVADSLLNSDDHRPDARHLQALIDFAQEHFEYEEGVMRSAAYPEAERHAKYHVSLLTELRTYCAKVRRGVSTNPASMIDFLRDWLVLHIETVDRDLALWLTNERLAPT